MKKIIVLMLLALVFKACNNNDDDDNSGEATLDTTPFVLEIGNFPQPILPQDNALTVAGVELGRMLFFEKRLSKNNTQACADCHKQQDAFNDLRRFSLGIEALPGTRNAMGVFNMAWHNNQFFWDGRANLLREQALMPIEDPLEMNETLDNVVAKLTALDTYTEQFTRTFGSPIVTAPKIGLALEQFMLSIVSNNAKYDQYLAGQTTLTESEERGRLLFFTEYNPFFPEQSGADCAHCHGGFNFTNDKYMNNGLDAAPFADFGREIATGNSADRAKFKVPSLRNIALSPPYMHDGRFETLEQTIRHYNQHIKNSATIDPALIQVIDNGGLQLSQQDISDLVDFLHTLTDETLLINEAYSDPF